LKLKVFLFYFLQNDLLYIIIKTFVITKVRKCLLPA